MMYDLAIIGAGPGGYEAALYAAKKNLKVVLIEKDLIGGTCLNSGCIPTKAILSSAKAYRLMKSAGKFGIEISEGSLSLSYEKVMARKDSIVDINRKALEGQLRKAGITLVFGSAKIIDVTSISVTGQPDPITARYVIVATGTRTANIGNIEIDHKDILSSDDMLSSQELPESMIIMGGGVMGCEFAFIFAEFGVNVTVVEAQDFLLPLEDHDISTLILREMKKKKIKVLTGKKIEKIEHSASGINIIDSDGALHSAQKLLVTVGRRKITDNLGLIETGITLDKQGSIAVNDYMQTSVPTIYAVGDVSGKKMVAHVAAEQGRSVIDHILGIPRKINYKNVPMSIFTIPEIGSVGLTENELINVHLPYVSKQYLYRSLGKAQAEDEIVGLFKILFEPESGVILGVHIMGEHASDIIMEAAIAMETAITVSAFTNVIHAHPTYAEGLRLTMLE